MFVQFPAFALEAADLGKPVSISFDVTGVTTSGDWDVVVVRYNASGTYQELIPVAGTASGSSVTPSARLPTGTFRGWPGFFVAGSTAGDLYALRFRRLAGSMQIRLDTLYVGPQAQLLGAAMTDPVQHTPTFNGFGTVASSSIWRAQSGPFFIGYGNFTAGTVAASEASLLLPSGLTVDTTKLPSNERIVGRWTRNNASGSAVKSGPLIVDTANNDRVKFAFDDYTTAANPFVARNGNGIAATGDNIAVEFRVPISNWSSNVTMAERAVEEYAWNGDTGVTAATTYSSSATFGNGHAGTPILSVASTSVGTSQRTAYRVQFQTAIQATDDIRVEVQEAAGTPWVPVQSVYGLVHQRQADAAYGIGWRAVSGSTTQVDVVFGNGGANPNSTFGTAGAAWSGFSGWRWRIRKTSSGGAAGFPVGARNVVGDTTGTAVPTGYLGEQQRGAQTTPQTLTTATALTITSITLTPGVWDVSAILQFATTTITGTRVSLYVSTAANTTGSLIAVDATGSSPTAPTSACDQTLQVSQVRYLVAASTTIYLNAYGVFSAGNLSATGRLSAVRVG